MKETELLGTLMPPHPDILPIIENIREKYQIPEVSPEDEKSEAKKRLQITNSPILVGEFAIEEKITLRPLLPSYHVPLQVRAQPQLE